MGFRLPGIDDFLMFSNWDAWLWFAYLFAGAVLCGLCGRWAAMHKDELWVRKYQGLRARYQACAVGALAVACFFTPDRGPGIWGVFAIGMLAITLVNFVGIVRKGKLLIPSLF